MYFIIIFVIILFIGLYNFSWNRKNGSSWNLPKEVFPLAWRIILNENVVYYKALTNSEKKKFEYKVQEFLLNCSITGVDTEVTDFDKILVASSAIIPIFVFKDWKYVNLKEVLIYPTIFNAQFETEGPDRRISGMVGNGYMDGIMILSQEALKHGFQNESDKANTAIHEFVHLIDKRDGTIDGIPSALLEKQYVIPWIDFMDKKLDEIYDGKSDINPYGGTNRAEFFSVTSEYFFERPKLLKKKHPDLYQLLERIFKQDMSSINLNSIPSIVQRNDLCPCDSGIKYKKCCGFVRN